MVLTVLENFGSWESWVFRPNEVPKHFFEVDDFSVFSCLLVGRNTGFGMSMLFSLMKNRTNLKRLIVELYPLTVGLGHFYRFRLFGLFLAVEKKWANNQCRHAQSWVFMIWYSSHWSFTYCWVEVLKMGNLRVGSWYFQNSVWCLSN